MVNDLNTLHQTGCRRRHPLQNAIHSAFTGIKMVPLQKKFTNMMQLLFCFLVIHHSPLVISQSSPSEDYKHNPYVNKNHYTF